MVYLVVYFQTGPDSMWCRTPGGGIGGIPMSSSGIWHPVQKHYNQWILVVRLFTYQAYGAAGPGVCGIHTSGALAVICSFQQATYFINNRFPPGSHLT